MANNYVPNRIVGMTKAEKGTLCECMVSVDEVFASDDPDCDRRILFHCFGGGKLKLFYTEFPVYLLNDSGKTVERI
jgi:hypothetical protein